MHRVPTCAIIAFSLGVCGISLWSCDRPGTPQPAAADTPTANAVITLSPVESIHRARDLRWRREYKGLRGIMIGAGCDETIQFMKSVDEVLDAHDRLQAAAKDRFGDRIHHAWNISAMRNNLGLFSRKVTIVNQTMRGASAFVTLQEADHVPLIRVELRRVDGAWKIVPPMSNASICGPLRQFASRIDDVTNRVRSGLSPEGYFNAVTNELLPGMAQVAAGTSVDSRQLAESESPE
ncbi:MAG: hypothetical protein KDA33_01955 [Phycisphaerales bacterium]|nr:hypothetical protein [Phycisphaerales bacterium]